MELITFLFDFILHVDQHIQTFVQNYGAWTYGLLFLIVFIETGLVVIPFLPGDTLLFVVGTLAGAGVLNLPLAMLVLVAAAILGDQCNYGIGRFFGPKVFQWEHSRWFNKKAFERAHAFYETYGGVTIVLARFLPFIRTFAPFVGGVAAMSRWKFTLYNIAGGVLWVLVVCVAGYFLGSLPWVRRNLEYIIWAMLLLPGVLVIYGAWRGQRKASRP
jgi:membrane-associated protein